LDSQYDFVCFRKTLASLMDATLDQVDPQYRNWFAANTYSVTKQLQKVTFLLQVLPNGTMLLDEGFDDTQVMMNKDSFGRQFERACVPRKGGEETTGEDVKTFQAYATSIDGFRVLVCTPPDAMMDDERPVEIKLRLPPLLGLTDREEFCNGLVNLRLEMLGFGEKSEDGEQVHVTRIERRERGDDDGASEVCVTVLISGVPPIERLTPLSRQPQSYCRACGRYTAIRVHSQQSLKPDSLPTYFFPTIRLSTCPSIHRGTHSPSSPH